MRHWAPSLSSLLRCRKYRQNRLHRKPGKKRTLPRALASPIVQITTSLRIALRIAGLAVAAAVVDREVLTVRLVPVVPVVPVAWSSLNPSPT